MIDSKTGQEVDKVIIVRIYPDGSETIVGYKTEIQGEDRKPIQQFVCVSEDDKPVKQLSKDELAEIDAKKSAQYTRDVEVKHERALKRKEIAVVNNEYDEDKLI